MVQSTFRVNERGRANLCEDTQVLVGKAGTFNHRVLVVDIRLHNFFVFGESIKSQQSVDKTLLYNIHIVASIPNSILIIYAKYFLYGVEYKATAQTWILRLVLHCFVSVVILAISYINIFYIRHWIKLVYGHETRTNKTRETYNMKSFVHCFNNASIYA